MNVQLSLPSGGPSGVRPRKGNPHHPHVGKAGGAVGVWWVGGLVGEWSDNASTLLGKMRGPNE